MRRHLRHQASVVRSIGVAERQSRTGLSQLNVTRFLAVTCVAALALVPTLGAHASTTTDQVASARRAVDAIAQRWFHAQNDAAQLDARIKDIERQTADAQARVAATRKIATARAVMLYKTNAVGLSSVFSSDALDTGRRAELADQANSTSQHAIDELTAAVEDLKLQRQDLESQRAKQRTVLDEVTHERSALDAQLTTLRARAHQEAETALAEARSLASRAKATARLRSLAPVQTSNPVSAPTGPAGDGSSNPPPPTGGQVSPHHNDPFLACTRARESNGIYSINTGNGYYGAYQFLPQTWDSVAVHAGRMDLVGVLPSSASPYDQDEIAWALFQWQGTAPWGGRC